MLVVPKITQEISCSQSVDLPSSSYSSSSSSSSSGLFIPTLGSNNVVDTTTLQHAPVVVSEEIKESNPFHDSGVVVEPRSLKTIQVCKSLTYYFWSI